MNDFDQRWQTLAENARQAPENSHEDLPVSFTTRVLARAREASSEAWEDALSFLGLRAVMATSVVLLLSAGFAFSEWFDSRIQLPALDKTITSDLTWP